ncbi:methyltransferase domain containing protein [Nitzschia inconspicua]|uniref:Methyltransferase domain containing protein n=1 Tax=Nitzschia inconspicua TaxID=303405 RepID=A0A9K3M570_9STRA|nr:methyltransferase domain containing protein [Nitzschia inconspicua]
MESKQRPAQMSRSMVLIWAASVAVFHQIFQLIGMTFAPSMNENTAQYLNLPMIATQQRHPILDLKHSKAVALPSIRIEQDVRSPSEKYYGGKGDKQHLGGFASGSVDMDGVSPAAWTLMLKEHGIKSLLDIGCGRGVSTSWFYMHGIDAQCVEGSHDAWEQSLIPNTIRTEHDFSRGPWWPSKTVDAVWCVEVLEHVGRNFHENLMPAMRHAAFLYVTHSTWGGWHHVEVHEEEWWITRFQSFGFVYSNYLTKQVRSAASASKTIRAPNNSTYNAQHIWLHMLVFINPTVASLPQHAHLLSELSCTNGSKKENRRPCKTESKESTLPPAFQPLEWSPELDAAWEKHVFGSTTIPQ